MKFTVNKILFLALLISFSCSDYLEPDPVSFISGDSFYSNDDELETGIFTIYDGLQGINDDQFDDLRSVQGEYMLTEMRSDNTKSRSGGNAESDFQQFEIYQIDVLNFVVRNYYESMYNVLHRIHLVLDNLDAASDERRAAFEGEAKFVRAYTYFQLVRLFGAVPMPLTQIRPEDEETSFTRIDENIIYAQIVEDLEIAIENLDDSFKTRASRSAARALLAKVYLTIAGDPELNPDVQQTDGYLAARELCEAVINEGSFSLMPGYLEVFTNERNAEIIWAIDFIPDNLETSQNFSLEWTDDGDRRLNYTTQNIRSVYAARGETERALFAPSEIVGEFFVTKYLPDGGILEQAGNDWVVLRYADVLLMYVEAVLGGNQATGEPQALTLYNEVRARAGFTTPVTSISRNELLEERRMEFAFENQRFFDLVRFGVAGEVLSAHSEATGGDFVDTDLLLPIPQNEISLSRGLLEQNLGY